MEDSITMAKRTTHRSSKGTKLYAVRDEQGQFDDVQTYKRAHGGDLKRRSAAEEQTTIKAKKAKKAKTAKTARKAKATKAAKKARKAKKR